MSLREHIPHPHHHQGNEDSQPVESHADEPIPGYDHMSVHDLLASMHTHTQAQMEAIREYEAKHKNRKAIFDKLDYMQGPEPWEGYDEMSEDQILERLAGSEDSTVTRVRDYEHKFYGRPRILDLAMGMHRKTMDEAPPRDLPPFKPGGHVEAGEHS